jgi:hypothetical protein
MKITIGKIFGSYYDYGNDVFALDIENVGVFKAKISNDPLQRQVIELNKRHLKKLLKQTLAELI